MRGWPVGLVMWLVALAGAQAIALVVVWQFFVLTSSGQLLDTYALTGNTVGPPEVGGVVTAALNAISAASVLAATVTVGFIALIQRRFAVAVGAMLLIIGANLTTQLAKGLIVRPDLGIDPDRVSAGNSLPSGHTAVVASVAVALLLVLPARMRVPGAIGGGLLAASAGVATLSAGWHRPSDAVAALLIVGVWSCVASLVIVAAQRHHGAVAYGESGRVAAVSMIVVGLGLLVGAILALGITDQSGVTDPAELGPGRLLAAYAGGAMAIAGSASLVMASVLLTVHRVVPQTVLPAARVRPPDPVSVGR